MNSTIAESLGNNTGLEDEAIKYKNYLNNLKRNYLENLSLTSPANKQQKLLSSNNNRKVASAVTPTTRRKIEFTPENNGSLKFSKNSGKAVDYYHSDDDDDSSLSLRENMVKSKIEDQQHKSVSLYLIIIFINLTFVYLVIDYTNTFKISSNTRIFKTSLFYAYHITDFK